MKNRIIYQLKYIFIIIIISVGTAVFVVDVAKDAFAFGKAPTSAKIEIPENADVKQIAGIFRSAGFV